MCDETEYPALAEDITYERYVLNKVDGDITGGLATDIFGLASSLGQLFNTCRLVAYEPNDADSIYTRGGIALSCWLLNALDAREGVPETASHAEKRLGLTIKTRVLNLPRDSFKLPLPPELYMDVMRACHDVATMFACEKGDAFAIVSEDFWKTDNYAGLVLLRWPAFYKAFGVSSLKEWYATYGNITRMEMAAYKRVGVQINPQFV
ncbi:MAG: hypothetical protein EON60_07250 [Alphaproteobacteria bacterium]|nr:MAG: hypothetical protein EON60_07250 [Alphaproteobacteria bacterium]